MLPGLTSLAAPLAVARGPSAWVELDWLRANQDLVWFVALVGWSFALVLWRWHSPRRQATAWLPWAAGVGAAGAVVQFGLSNPPFGFFFARLVPGTTSTYAPALIEPNVAGEYGLVAMTAALCTAWGWQLLGDRWRNLARWFTPLPPLAFVALHRAHPLAGGSTLAITAVLLAFLLIRQSRPTVGTSGVIGAIGLAPVFSTYGPLAVVTDSLQRSGPPTFIGLLAALWQASAAVLAILVLVRPSPKSDRPSEPLWRATEARPYLLAASVACIVGLAFSLKTAADQREELLQNRLRRAASAAKTIDPALLAPLVTAEFNLAPPAPPSALPLPATAIVEGLANGRSDALVRELARIVRATPFLSVARIVVLRDGWLVAAASNQPPGPPGTVELLRAATPQDQAYAAAGASHVEAAAVPEFDRHFYCRGALTGADGRLLGWLEFTQTESYMSSLRRFRAAPLLLTALGLTLIAGAFVQRRQSRAREAALRSAAVAAEASRLKTDFLAKVSHELRTPLQGLLGYSELLENDVVSDMGRSRIAALRQNGNLMLRLVNDLLDLTALEAGGFRFVDRAIALPSWTLETIESLRPRAEEKGLTLSCSVAPNFPPWVMLDGERFRQVLLNLAGNAVKFTDRGRVDLSLTAQSPGPDGHCLLELVVRDTGPGISPGDQVKLFQPFSRLDLTAQKEGSGLGLALAAALCRRTGGALTVESDGRTGSCFRATFRAQLAAPPALTPAASHPLPSLAARRLLIVDDNVLVRDLFTAWLSELGAICESAADGEEAILRAQAANFDAVVLDLALPGLDGLAVTRRWRAAGRRWRIVGVSAHASEADRTVALTAGMDAFLSKPVELAALVAALVPVTPPPTAPGRHARLRASLAARFRAQAPDDVARLRTAWQERDWTSLRARAHHLRSSAGVVGDERLYAACGALEDAAESRNASAAVTAWATCESALAPWLSS